MLTERQMNILELIGNNDQHIDIDILMETLEKSERTIRYDISTIRKKLEMYHVDIAFSSENGFYIPINHRVLYDLAMSELQLNITQETSVPFKEDIFNDLLFYFAVEKTYQIDKLSQMMYLSQRSLHEYILMFNEEESLNFKIKNTRNLGYTLEGDEIEFNLKLAEIISPLISAHNSAVELHKNLPKAIAKVLSVEDIESIVKNYKKHNSMFQLWLNSKTYHLILAYLLISNIRIQKNLSLDQGELLKLRKPMCQDTEDYITGILGNYRYNQNQLSMYRKKGLASILERFDVYIQNKLNTDSEILEVLDEIVDFLGHDPIAMHYVFDFKGLKNDLMLHFQNFLTRNFVESSDEELFILEDLKLKYKDYYHLAKRCGLIFKEHFNVNLSDKELSYITIYLVKNVLSGTLQKKVIVVCATGRGLSTLLVTRIRQVFPTLEVLETMSFFQLGSLKHHDDIDFVISTIPIENSIYPVVKISNVLSNTDIRLIHEHLNEEIYVDYSRDANLMNYFNDFDLDRAAGENMQKYSTIISEIILSLIRFTTDISDKYPMPVDSILGLTIHLVMAIPRWFEPAGAMEHNQEEAILELQRKHPELIRTMNVFFKNIESSLQVSISEYERVAFYQYIIKGD